MDVEQALFERLVDQVSLVSGRVSAAPAPEAWQVPLVTYQMMNGAPQMLFGMPSTTWWQPNFQVTVWAADYETMMAVTAQVRTAVHGWAAVLTGLTVDFAFIDNQRDLEDPTFDPPLIGRAFDVTVSCEGGG